MIYVVSGEGRR